MESNIKNKKKIYLPITMLTKNVKLYGTLNKERPHYNTSGYGRSNGHLGVLMNI